jgi:hypothetical protein
MLESRLSITSCRSVLDLNDVTKILITRIANQNLAGIFRRRHG